MHAPAVARVVVDLLVEGRRGLDVMMTVRVSDATMIDRVSDGTETKRRVVAVMMTGPHGGTAMTIVPIQGQPHRNVAMKSSGAPVVAGCWISQQPHPSVVKSDGSMRGQCVVLHVAPSSAAKLTGEVRANLQSKQRHLIVRRPAKLPAMCFHSSRQRLDLVVRTEWPISSLRQRSHLTEIALTTRARCSPRWEKRQCRLRVRMS